MHRGTTPERMPTRRAVRSVELTRRQIAGIVLIACVPLPLLSLATTVIPLPQLVERAAARFIPFVPPTLEDEPKRVVRAAPTRARPADTSRRRSEARSRQPDAGSRVEAARPTRATPATRTPAKRTAEPAPREPTTRDPAGETPTPSGETPTTDQDGGSETPTTDQDGGSDTPTAPTPTSVASAEPEQAAPTKKKAKGKPALPAASGENGGGVEKAKQQDEATSQPAPEPPGAQSTTEPPGRSGESHGGGNEDKPGGSGRP